MTAQPVDPQRIRAGAEYETTRAAAQDAVAETRRRHRIDLGDRLSLVFETPDTLAAVLEETLRNERITDADRVAAEVAGVNATVPAAIGIAASVYLDIADAAELVGAVAEVEGLAEHLYLEVAGNRTSAQVYGVEDEEPSPATLVVFPLSAEQRRGWRQRGEVRLGVDHPVLHVETTLSDEQRSLLAPSP